jgi:3-hydroxyacyl-CoA dehydrogenase
MPPVTVKMLLVPYLTSAIRMYEESFDSREDIDTAMKRGCAHPMGSSTLSGRADRHCVKLIRRRRAR